MQDVINNFKLLIPNNIGIIDFIQILIIFLVLYYVLRELRKTRAWILVKGLAVLGLMYLIFYLSGMVVLQIIMQSMFSVMIIAFVIMFQPDLQKFVESLGTNKIQNPLTLLKGKAKEDTYYSEETIKEIIQACEIMSEAKTGALIALEREIPLSEYIDSGIDIKAEVSYQLLINTFEKNTPLHDGAVIIKNNKVEAATCYLPLSKSKGIKKSLGTRHRAAIGLSENTDAIVVVVSEETGKIAVAFNGKIKEDLSRSALYDYLISKGLKFDKKKKEENEHSTSFLFKASILVVSVLLWSIIINVEDPIQTKLFTDIPVSIVNNDVLIDADKTFEVIQGTSVDIQAKARRSILNNLNKNSFVASADFSEMSIVNAVPIRVISRVNNVDVKITSADIMKLQLEDLIQTEVPITVSYTGQIAEGHYLYSATPTVSSVVVKGSKTVVNSIGKADANVSIFGIDDDITLTAPIVIYDKDGNKITSDSLSVNIDSVDVEVEVYDTKEVKVDIRLSDSSNYRLIAYEAEDVLIAADDWNLRKTSSVIVELNPELLDLTKNEFVVNLSLYLPEDVYLPVEQSETITVTLEIEKE